MVQERKENYLNDIKVCKSLLNMLEREYTVPGWNNTINSEKVKRIRLTIHEILKKY